MEALKLFESLLNEGQKKEVKEFLEKYDRETANIMMLMVADRFQFKAVEIKGDVYATAAELASTMGISPRGIRKLLRKYDIHGWNITSEPVVPRSVHERLGLKTRDSSTLLFGWEALLVIGFNGRTINAKNVRDYLLGMERFGRMELHTQLNEGRTLKEKLESELKHPQDYKDIVETVSNDAITISKDRYIELLEGEVRILKLRRFNKDKPVRPLCAREKEEILVLHKEGLGYTRISRIIRRPRTTIRDFLDKIRS